MRAVWLDRYVQPGEIAVRDVPDPEPGDGDVLVRLLASAINPSDVKYAAGVVQNTTLPRIPGRDFAGIVERGPAHLIGASVCGTGGDLGITRHGAHAELISVPAGAVAVMPSTLTMVQAAAVGVPYVTAYKALVEIAVIQAGESVLLIGASGAVGSAAGQIAKGAGCTVIGTSRRAEELQSLKSYVDVVVSPHSEDVTHAALIATDGRGAAVVFNMVGGETFEPGVRALAEHGRMVCIAASGEHRVSFDLMAFYKRQLRWFGLDTLELSASDCRPILDLLLPGFEDGRFRVRVGSAMPLERASEAYALVAAGDAGKVVLTM